MQGLCDMAGNVYEWIEDDWHDDYRNAPVDGSAWVDEPRGSLRVNRSGSFFSSEDEARVAHRLSDDPTFVNDLTGFRLARDVP